MITHTWVIDKVSYEIEEARAVVTVSDMKSRDKVKLRMQLDFVDLPRETKELQAFLLGEAHKRLAIITGLMTHRETETYTRVLAHTLA